MSFRKFDLNEADYTAIYGAKKPFPHIVIDDFWLNTEELKKAYDEIYTVPIQDFFYNDQHEHQLYKRGLGKLDAMPPTLKKIIETLNSQDTLDYLSRLTGIYGLKSDPTLWGGGVHVTSRGGKLGIHSDYNLHYETQYHRRLNLLLYLNPVWEENWGGSLELWDEQMVQMQEKIVPKFNRMAMFNTTSESYHGHPDPLTCPDEFERASIALYYFTEDRPDYEKRDAHGKALWQIRPESNDPVMPMDPQDIKQAQQIIELNHTAHQSVNNLKDTLDQLAVSDI